MSQPVTLTQVTSNTWRSSNGLRLVKLRIGGYMITDATTWAQVANFSTKRAAVAWIAAQR